MSIIIVVVIAAALADALEISTTDRRQLFITNVSIADS